MNVVDVRKVVHHPLLLKLAQGVKMQMVVAFVPQPSIIAHASGEAEGTPNLDPEQI
jgi:hypothetical protein